MFGVLDPWPAPGRRRRTRSSPRRRPDAQRWVSPAARPRSRAGRPAAGHQAARPRQRTCSSSPCRFAAAEALGSEVAVSGLLPAVRACAGPRVWPRTRGHHHRIRWRDQQRERPACAQLAALTAAFASRVVEGLDDLRLQDCCEACAPYSGPSAARGSRAVALDGGVSAAGKAGWAGAEGRNRATTLCSIRTETITTPGAIDGSAGRPILRRCRKCNSSHSSAIASPVSLRPKG
jgi:hypothetical protein